MMMMQEQADDVEARARSWLGGKLLRYVSVGDSLFLVFRKKEKRKKSKFLARFNSLELMTLIEVL